MSLITRRRFLSGSSLLAVGAVSGIAPFRTVKAHEMPLTGDALVPEPVDEPMLRQLAATAIDAAIAAGASYVDVRVADRQSLALSLFLDYDTPGLSVGASFSYGIRVLVDGCWAFVHGQTPTFDGLAYAARDAVVEARAIASMSHRTAEFVPGVGLREEWTSAEEILPYTVSIRDQTIQLSVFNAAIRHTQEAIPESVSAFEWVRESRVFASSEGASLVQRSMRASPRVAVLFYAKGDYLQFEVPEFRRVFGGYEVVLRPDLPQCIHRTAEDGARIANLPLQSLDVGRYPTVAQGNVVGTLMANTVNPALELDRALGDEADTSGISYLAPPLEILRAPVPTFSPLLSVIANHRGSHSTIPKWDDDGIEPQPYTVIDRGRVVDYHSTRDTAPALSEWYREQHTPLGSHGCAEATEAHDLPTVVGRQLYVTPSAQAKSLDMLQRDVSHGILLCQCRCVPEAGGAFALVHGTMLKLDGGEPVGRLKGVAIQFRSLRFWNQSLRLLGDESTMMSASVQIQKGYPWKPVVTEISAPAASFSDLDVISYKWG